MRSHPTPVVAASLSFVLPGLGQLTTGAHRRGLLFAAPAVAIFLALVALASAGPTAIADLVVRPDVLVGLLVLNLAIAAYHGVAVVDAWRSAGPSERRPVRRAAPALLVLLTLTLAGHGALEAVGYSASTTFDAVFGPSDGGTDWVVPEPSFESDVPSSSPGSPAPSMLPTPTPSAPPTSTPVPSPSPTVAPAWARDGRLDLLLIGSDAGPDRWSLRTDTMIVLSIDVATGRAALFGVPRNMVGVPLPPESAGAFADGRFPGLLNALYVYAMGHPGAFPGGDARGFRAVTGAVQELVGVRLDGVVVVNLTGFVRLVNAIGGLWIDVPERLVDRNYPLEDGSGHLSIDIAPGCQHLDGRMALAYARSRHQDSDYGRMHRQQVVLVALARQVDPLALVPKVPDLLAIARDNLWTTVRRSDVAALARLAAHVNPASVKTTLFVPSRYPEHLTTDRKSVV